MTTDKKIIGFFHNEGLANKRIDQLNDNRLEGDFSTYLVEKIDRMFVVYGIVKRSEQLQNELNSLFA